MTTAPRCERHACRRALRCPARLVGQGTHTGVFEGIAPTGRTVRTQELVFYRVVGGKIVGVWGDLFPVVRDALRALDAA
nr:ester cyclase [Quadrisphaera granulorum]